MKRWLLYLALLVAGYVVGALKIQQQASEDLARSKEQWRDDIADLRQRVYEFVPHPSASAYDPATSGGLIQLSYVGGHGAADRLLELHGDGQLKAEVGGKVRLLRTLPQEECTSLFRRVLTSGILGCSEAIIELKRDLLLPEGWKGVTDHPTTRIRISAPAIGADLDLSVYAPEVDLENYPDIIEYKLITRLESDLLALVPENDSFRK